MLLKYRESSGTDSPVPVAKVEHPPKVDSFGVAKVEDSVAAGAVTVHKV